MSNETIIKSKTDALPSCLIRTDHEELGQMISAILGEHVRPIPEPPADVIITVDTDCVTVSSPDGEVSARLERPIIPNDLKHAVSALSQGHSTPHFSADPTTRSAVLGDKSVGLTDTEFRLYSAILENGGFTSAEELSRKVWGRFDRNLCTVYLSYLRRKLDSAFGDGTLITARGKGYRLRSTKSE